MPIIFRNVLVAITLLSLALRYNAASMCAHRYQVHTMRASIYLCLGYVRDVVQTDVIRENG